MTFLEKPISIRTFDAGAFNRQQISLLLLPRTSKPMQGASHQKIFRVALQYARKDIVIFFTYSEIFFAEASDYRTKGSLETLTGRIK
jgi:hypothetical protein